MNGQAGGGWKIEGLSPPGRAPGSSTVRQGGEASERGVKRSRTTQRSERSESVTAVGAGMGTRFEQPGPEQGVGRFGPDRFGGAGAVSSTIVAGPRPWISGSRREKSADRPDVETTRWLQLAEAVRAEPRPWTRSSRSAPVPHRLSRSERSGLIGNLGVEQEIPRSPELTPTSGSGRATSTRMGHHAQEYHKRSQGWLARTSRRMRPKARWEGIEDWPARLPRAGSGPGTPSIRPGDVSGRVASDGLARERAWPVVPIAAGIGPGRAAGGRRGQAPRPVRPSTSARPTGGGRDRPRPVGHRLRSSEDPEVESERNSSHHQNRSAGAAIWGVPGLLVPSTGALPPSNVPRYPAGMIRSFRHKEAERILLRERKEKSSRPLQRAALRELLMRHAAESLDDLLVPPGNRLEKLGGDRSGQYQVQHPDQRSVADLFHLGGRRRPRGRDRR